MKKMPHKQPHLIKGLLAGLAGGLLASFLMEQFQSLWTKAAKELGPERSAGKTNSKNDPSTVKTAEAISTRLVHRQIPENKKNIAGEIVHYAMGATSGAIYGVAAELIPLATAAEGLAFGTTVWIAADNTIVPALGLAKRPTQTPVSTHLYALASHLVYGFITETVRRATCDGISCERLI